MFKNYIYETAKYIADKKENFIAQTIYDEFLYGRIRIGDTVQFKFEILNGETNLSVADELFSMNLTVGMIETSIKHIFCKNLKRGGL